MRRKPPKVVQVQVIEPGTTPSEQPQRPRNLRKMLSDILKGYEGIIVGDGLAVSAATSASLNVQQNGLLVAGGLAATAAFIWGVRRFARRLHQRVEPGEQKTSAGADRQQTGAIEARKWIVRLPVLAPGIGVVSYAIVGGLGLLGPQGDQVFATILATGTVLNICTSLHLWRLATGRESGASVWGSRLRLAAVTVALMFGMVAASGGSTIERITRATIIMTAMLYNCRLFWGDRKEFDVALDEIGSYLRKVTTVRA
jgi:hypothetical protein